MYFVVILLLNMLDTYRQQLPYRTFTLTGYLESLTSCHFIPDDISRNRITRLR